MLTTNQLVYGMRDAHPEIYRAAVRAGKAHLVPNLTYQSSWGSSLKGKNQLKSSTSHLTTYQKFNQEVFNKPTLTSESKQMWVALASTRFQSKANDSPKFDNLSTSEVS